MPFQRIVIVLRLPNDLVFERVNSCVTPQFRRVPRAAPVDLLVDVLLLNVHIAVVRLQLDPSLLAVYEHEIAGITSDVRRCDNIRIVRWPRRRLCGRHGVFQPEVIKFPLF